MTDHKRTYSQRGDDYLIEAQKVCKKNEPVQVVHCKECAWKANRPPEGHTLRPDADGYCLVHGHDVTFGEFCSSGESVGEKEKPKCPYCGHKMVHQYVYGDHFFRCPKCRSTAPDKETEDEAYEAAMKRYRETNRVLTMEEVEDACKLDNEMVLLWVEFNCNGVRTLAYQYCTIDETIVSVDLLKPYNEVENDFSKMDYCKKWRCWLRKPTQEEMEAVPWETT